MKNLSVQKSNLLLMALYVSVAVLFGFLGIKGVASPILLFGWALHVVCLLVVSIWRKIKGLGAREYVGVAMMVVAFQIALYFVTFLMCYERGCII